MNAILPSAPLQPRPVPDRPLQPDLPRWQQLPAARQRELVLTLASLLLKRLAGPGPTPAEVRRE